MPVHEFQVGDLACAVVSDGGAHGPLPIFFNPESGVPETALRQALLEEARGRSTIDVNYNCLLVRTESGAVLVDTGLGEQFIGYGPELGAKLGKLGASLSEAGVSREHVRVSPSLSGQTLRWRS